MINIINIICLLIWIGWLIYGIFGTNADIFRGGLICSSIVCIVYYVQLITGVLK